MSALPPPMTPMPPTPGGSDYPVRFWVDPPEGRRNRVTVAFRIILAVPILILVITIGTSGTNGVLFIPVLLMLLFRHKYPRWWFDWNRSMWRLENRVAAYFLLLRDEYPAIEEEQAVHLEVEYPDVQRDLNRALPLVKWFLAIPHLFLLFFLGLAAVVVTIVAWFAILFTGRHPKGMFDFVVGVMRWQNRVTAYAFALVTDRYPPFSLQP